MHHDLRVALTRSQPSSTRFSACSGRKWDPFDFPFVQAMSTISLIFFLRASTFACTSSAHPSGHLKRHACLSEPGQALGTAGVH